VFLLELVTGGGITKLGCRFAQLAFVIHAPILFPIILAVFAVFLVLTFSKHPNPPFVTISTLVL
jgi:hypothetical protein